MANLSQERREEWLNYIDRLKELHNDDADMRLLNELELALTEKKYGLVWEEHSEQVDEMLESNVPIFVEDESKLIKNDESDGFNFLLEGDNLHSLKLLQKTHKGKIDVIYIDPPYNTKNKEFIYDDCRIGEDDGYRHSKWLSFMHKRLTIAKNLLTNDGIIFINIDENEHHQLKLLCDEVFNEINYIGEFIWKARSGKGGTTSFISMEHENILCYAKDKNKSNFYMDIRISNTEKTEQLRQWGQAVYREDRPTMFFPIFYNKKKNTWKLPTEEEIDKLYDSTELVFNDKYLTQLLDLYKNNGYIGYLPKIDSKYGRWRRGYTGIQELIDDNLLVLDNEKVKRIIPGGNITKTAVNSILDLNVGTSSTGTKQIKELFNNVKVFDTTKPIELIKYLINLGIYNKEHSIVVDFFAGSGTTGHAVQALNKEDGGNRKYILCTNNENNICEEVTYKRLTNIQDELPHNLKYFKTDFIPKLSDEEHVLSSELLHGMKELVELENMTSIDGKKKVLVLNDDDLSKLNEIEEDGTLYISTHVLLSREEEIMLQERNVAVIDIPDYYYLEELIEAGER